MSSAPIFACVGHNGSGKDLVAITEYVIPALDSPEVDCRDCRRSHGRWVLANQPLFASGDDQDLPAPDFGTLPGAEPLGTRRLHPRYVPLTSWTQLVGTLDKSQGHERRLCRATIYITEIGSCFDSHSHGSTPAAVRTRMRALRKTDAQMVWTSPSWEDAEAFVRRVTQGVWDCSGHRPKRVEGRTWPTNRLIKARYYSGRKFDEFSVAAAHSDRKGTIRPEFRRRHRTLDLRAAGIYDTFAEVQQLDHHDLSGACWSCGGHRKRLPCTCAEYLAVIDATTPARSRRTRASS
jgi:hypothetical protein